MRPSYPSVLALALCACGSSSSGGTLPDGGAGSGGSAGSSGSGGSAGIAGSGGASGGSGGSGALGSSFGPAEVLADKQTNCYRVAIAAGRLFWNSRGSTDGIVPGGLFSIPLDGGVVETHHGTGVYALRVIDNQIYFSDASAISVMASDGSGKQPLVTNAGTALDLAMAEGSIWFTTDPGEGTATLQNAPIAGGPAQEVVPLGSPVYFTYLAAKDDLLYAVVLQTSGAATSLYRIPINSGQSEVVSDAHTAQLSVDDEHVYFASQSNPLRVALSGATPAETMGDQAGVSGTAVDPDALYVTVDESLNCEAGTGKVWRIPFATKIPELIADGLDCPGGITVDATGVYWVNAGTHLTVPVYSDPETGTVMRAKRL